MALFGRTALAAFLFLSAAGIAQAQQQAPLPFPNIMQGTPQEQAACAPDSRKFCKQFEPDPLQVLGCLQQNRTKISRACQQVLQNRGV
jgi:hypothetical protein